MRDLTGRGIANIVRTGVAVIDRREKAAYGVAAVYEVVEVEGPLTPTL